MVGKRESAGRASPKAGHQEGTLKPGRLDLLPRSLEKMVEYAKVSAWKVFIGDC